MHRFSFLCLAWLSLAAVGAGRDIFVNNQTGDDAFKGSQDVQTLKGDGPVRTLAKALRLAQRGDRLILANTGQPYRESISLVGGDHSGSFAGPFTLIGNGATLDGTFELPVAVWEHYVADVFRFSPPRKAFQQLYLNGRPAARRASEAGAATIARLQPLEWCLHEGHVYFCVEPGKTVHDYRLSCAGEPVGITLYQVHGVQIVDLVVQGFQLDGVNAHDGVRDCRLNGVVSRGNGRSGVAAGGTSRVELENCLVGDNGASQLYADGLSTITVKGSDILPNTAPAAELHGGQVLGLESPAPAGE